MDGIRKTILALAGTQIPGALRHTLEIPITARSECLVNPIGRLQICQHSFSPAQRIGGQPNGRPTFLADQGLVLNPNEGGVVVLDETAVELQGTAAGGKAEGAELGDRTRDAARALVVGEVATALEEAVDGVGRGWNGEVVVVGEGRRVDQRG